MSCCCSYFLFEDIEKFPEDEVIEWEPIYKEINEIITPTFLGYFKNLISRFMCAECNYCAQKFLYGSDDILFHIQGFYNY